MAKGRRSGQNGPWQARVRFGPGGGFAYRPEEVLVRRDVADQARELLEPPSGGAAGKAATDVTTDEVLGGAFVRFSGVPDALETVVALHQAGLPAQFNHVLFSTGCCPPHPSGTQANPFTANPFTANPFTANPFTANPFTANPFTANMGAGCGCGGGCSQANPFFAVYANADPSPFVSPWVQSTGRRRSSARPSGPPNQTSPQAAGDKKIRVAILDTGWAESHVPDGLPNIDVTPSGGDRPDEDGDDFLDPASGHGTFITGLIEQTAPGCELEVIEVLTTYGDGDELAIGEHLLALAQSSDGEPFDFVNLSFGGYSPIGMWVLAHAVTQLRRRGTVVVASAGNDATCVPMYPAALAQVISVAALDKTGNAAPFTNYGPWVDACTLGVDVVSLFFEDFNGAEPPDAAGADDDDFSGWAKWSGTSFAAPRVVAELARLAQAGTDPEDAVEQLIRAPGLARKPMLGTIV